MKFSQAPRSYLVLWMTSKDKGKTKKCVMPPILTLLNSEGSFITAIAFLVGINCEKITGFASSSLQRYLGSNWTQLGRIVIFPFLKSDKEIYIPVKDLEI